MPKIKIVKVYGYTDYDDDNNIRNMEDFSNWQEVSDEDLAFLKSAHGMKVLQNQTKPNVDILIIEDITSEKVINKFITDIKEFTKKEKEKLEQELELKAKRALERKEKEKQKKIEEAKKVLKESGLL